MKKFKCHKGLMNVIKKYFTIDDKGGCEYCPFSRAFLMLLLPNQNTISNTKT